MTDRKKQDEHPQEIAGQISLFDYAPDIWSGKTYPAPSVATEARTSEQYSKRPQKSQKATFLFLDLRTDDGPTREPSWEQGTTGLLSALPGDYMTPNIGEYPSDARESRLSQILEDGALQKYYLTARACQGILSRAERRGKELPEILKTALQRQAQTQTPTVSVSKNEQESLEEEKGY